MTSPSRVDQEAFLETAERMGGLPVTVGRLATLVADPEHEIDEIVSVVEVDQALTAAVLRLANSAATGMRFPVRTVHQAAVVLGGTALLGVALSLNLSGQMRAALPAYGLAEGMLWHQSVAASTAADIIRLTSDVQCPPESSTAALLHDFGKVVLCQHFGGQVLEMLATAAATEGISVVEAERAVLGIDHAMIGGLVAQSWQLPESIVEAIAYHHQAHEGLSAVCAVVSLAHAMVHDILEQPETPVLPETHHQVAFLLGIDPRHHPVLVRKARVHYDEIIGLYGG